MACKQGCAEREQRLREHRGSPIRKRRFETPVGLIESAASPDSQGLGCGDFLSNKVFNVPILRLPQLLQFPQFQNSLGPASPPGFSFVGVPSPSDPLVSPSLRGQRRLLCVPIAAAPPPQTPQRAPLPAGTPGPTWRLSSGSGHRRLARYTPALMGPARWPALCGVGQELRASRGREQTG